MKITNVRACQPATPTSPNDWRTSLGQILVAIDTDVGLTGYGVGGGGKAGIHVVLSVMRDLLLGRSPEPVESRWDEVYSATLAFGRKGLAVMAQSGVDLALWDLRGKAANLPVAALLGAPRSAPIPAYQTVWGAIPPNEIGRYAAFKLHVGKIGEVGVEAIVERVTQARQSVGDGVPLMLDAWMRWTVPFAREAARGLTGLGVDWIEEPLSPDDLAGYRDLSRNCAVPIAGGEHEFTAIGFAPLIEEKLHQVLQPDICWCGGMTEMVKIYRAARVAGLRVCPHRGGEPWGLHALAGLDPNPLAEAGRPWLAWVDMPVLEAGAVRLPDGPGFGAVVDESALT